MTDPIAIALVGASVLLALGLASLALLKGWNAGSITSGSNSPRTATSRCPRRAGGSSSPT